MIATATPTLAADVAGALTLTDQTDVRARAATGTDTSIDALNTPAARLILSNGRSTYWVGDSLTLTLPALQAQTRLEWFDTASVGATWRFSRETSLILSEDGSLGQQNFAYLSPTPDVSGQPSLTTPASQQLLTIGTLWFASSRTTLAAVTAPTRRLSLSTAIIYTASGGADAASQRTLPFQTSLSALGRGLYAVSRTDGVGAAVGLSRITTSPCSSAPVQSVGSQTTGQSVACSPESDELDVTGLWSHHVSRTTDSLLAAGVSAVREVFPANTPGANTHTAVFPSADLTVRETLSAASPAHEQLIFDARVAPVIDLRTGIPDERGQVSLTLTDRVQEWHILASIAAVQSLLDTPQGRATFVGPTVGVTYSITRRLDVGCTITGAWQRQYGATFITEDLYAFLAYRPLPLRIGR